MVVIKVLVQGGIISELSVYVPQCGLYESLKDDFFDSFMNFLRKLGEKGIVIIVRDFNGHMEVSMKVSIKGSMRVMEFGARKGKGFLHFVQL